MTFAFILMALANIIFILEWIYLFLRSLKLRNENMIKFLQLYAAMLCKKYDEYHETYETERSIARSVIKKKTTKVRAKPPQIPKNIRKRRKMLAKGVLKRNKPRKTIVNVQVDDCEPDENEQALIHILPNQEASNDKSLTSIKPDSISNWNITNKNESVDEESYKVIKPRRMFDQTNRMDEQEITGSVDLESSKLVENFKMFQVNRKTNLDEIKDNLEDSSSSNSQSKK